MCRVTHIYIYFYIARRKESTNEPSTRTSSYQMNSQAEICAYKYYYIVRIKFRTRVFIYNTPRYGKSINKMGRLVSRVYILIELLYVFSFNLEHNTHNILQISYKYFSYRNILGLFSVFYGFFTIAQYAFNNYFYSISRNVA